MTGWHGWEKAYGIDASMAGWPDRKSEDCFPKDLGAQLHAEKVSHYMLTGRSRVIAHV